MSGGIRRTAWKDPTHSPPPAYDCPRRGEESIDSLHEASRRRARTERDAKSKRQVYVPPPSGRQAHFWINDRRREVPSRTGFRDGTRGPARRQTAAPDAPPGGNALRCSARNIATARRT